MIVYFIWIFSFPFTKDDAEINRIYLQWQKSTIQSLESQMEGISPTSNVMPLFQSKYNYLINREKDVLDTLDFRYVFLKTIKASYPQLLKNSIVVEIVKEGEIYRHFKVVMDISDTNHLSAYLFQQKGENCELIKRKDDFLLRLEPDFSKSFVPYPKGFNSEHIEVTHFKDRQVGMNEYFILYTLSDESFVKKLLSIFLRV